MPWHSLNRPSLALGVLRAACAADGLPVPHTYHGTLAFAEQMLEAGLSVADFDAIADAGFQYAIGEWTFAGVLNGPAFGWSGMLDFAARMGVPMRTAGAIRALAEPFIERAAQDILAEDPELVGFSSTFSQNVPSLAVARRLKQLRPDLTVVLGGYNCEGAMGVALHREYPWVDLVLRGEGDVSFPLLLRALAGGDPAGVPGLCWRDEDGKQHVNEPGPPVTPKAMHRPDYDDWFAALDASAVHEHLFPELTLESSRGCWWGEKHHCTFCGLNSATMSFRAKSPDVFLGELTGLVARHRVLDVTTIDNILPTSYLSTVLPAIEDRGLDLKLHYEVKANLTTDQIRTLRAGQVWNIQPGIESLANDVLSTMDKGVRSVHNVRTLRDGEGAGITVAWNWLYGFPGESEVTYRSLIEQLPALVHLQPPSAVARVELHRFSPNFDRPELGFAERTAPEFLHHVYDRPADVLAELAYTFETPPRGLTEEQAAGLHAWHRTWTELYPDSSLVARAVAGVVVVRDRRARRPHQDYVLESAREIRVWTELAHGRTVGALVHRLAEAGIPWSEEDVEAFLAELVAHGLVFTDGHTWLALATDPGMAVTTPGDVDHRTRVG
ncbi:RiPP maturation radical SAM C-methyltransferase [Amycolatopsis sp. A133]|uniref:RiPP maturation radical SAM C-methyltransferase n=1 Tax=Amycolatopsis sp. A133 TaxID=3064472 RepID=UPI0027FC6F0A|nr:RiPP maturation radical SAM C-methyltransferase [Amycolatopsis sp. A133]MDQ7809110.1 RiPP maturation radical SAM C-methyltransferase [Amycolatopsis sp. A133]